MPKHTRRPGRRHLTIVAALAVTALSPLGLNQAQAESSARAAAAVAPSGWKLVYAEGFNSLAGISSAPWVRDPQGKTSPWNVDHLDDDGQFFDVQGGTDFRTQLAAADILRKRVSFGESGWLTVELAARDADKNGTPERPPSLQTVSLGGQDSGRIAEPSHDGGIIIRNTKALPTRYRIEYTLRTVDFGGKRYGSFNYDGRVNGYSSEPVCKTNWPWKRSGSFAGPADSCNPNFADVRAENGFSFLTITDYAKPAPHNNVFNFNHRKVGLDGYNVSGGWASSYDVCNPSNGVREDYPTSTANGINAIFFDGSRFKAPEVGYNQFVMPTECGTEYGETAGATILSAAEIQPELMPSQSYRFAIERDATGYTTEMTGLFLHMPAETTLSYHRNFVQDGHPIWHFNQTAAEYGGQFNQALTFSGPYGSYTKQQWPAGSAYPDYFVIGDPHLNYYEGSATIDDLKMYVPAP